MGKKGIYVIIGCALLLMVIIASANFIVQGSLPTLDGKISTPTLKAEARIDRDTLGTAIIHASDRQDAAYAMGYAHAQDRFFQMDLQRRNAAGELSALFGEKALVLDKPIRFHQFRKRAQAIVESLPAEQKSLLVTYAQGVNDALAAQTFSSFEYLLTGNSPAPWSPEDSILTIFSMYLDLQGATLQRDLVLTQLARDFGDDMVAFITQPSHYQAALDGSTFPLRNTPVPALRESVELASVTSIEDVAEVGSNNWAVTGKLTKSGHAMLSDDMHLSLRVPVIWYRAQLNYQQNQQAYQITGVSLPGVPAIVVGTNNHLAWGFTNGYLDTADWIALNDNEPVWEETETFHLPKGEQTMQLILSQFGPVKEVDGQKYALNWVAYQPYAVNLNLATLEQTNTVEAAMQLAPKMGIPVQNLMLADSQGNAGWRPAGAFPARSFASSQAIPEDQVDIQQWQQPQLDTPYVLNPESNRLWTANARVIGTTDYAQYGDGAYALGARAEQIKQRLFEKEQFNEQDFYQIQLDNQAEFLSPWQQLLVSTLTADDGNDFSQDINLLNQWGKCACSDSVGYSLVKAFRNQLIDNLFAPLQQDLEKQALSLKSVKRYLEPGIWQLLQQQPASWLPKDSQTWNHLLVTSYQQAKDRLLAEHSQTGALTDLRWGKVNAFTITHPFSKQVPWLASLLDMPVTDAWGDTYMPAVQGHDFGASQRLFVQPGNEENAILTIPGGQSGHPLSPYYRKGFMDYVNDKDTPLLPQAIEHSLVLSPAA